MTKERGILFKGQMVLALLDGSKTKTRRMNGLGDVNLDPDRYEFRHLKCSKGDVYAVFIDRRLRQTFEVKSYYGGVGSKPYVKETFASVDGGNSYAPIAYRADHKYEVGDRKIKWKSSMFMPRALSRIDLEITALGVERVQDITDAEAVAEGCPGVLWPNPDFPDEWDPSPREQFRDLWQSINGYDSWERSPWVWAISVRRIAAGRAKEAA